MTIKKFFRLRRQQDFDPEVQEKEKEQQQGYVQEQELKHGRNQELPKNDIEEQSKPKLSPFYEKMFARLYHEEPQETPAENLMESVMNQFANGVTLKEVFKNVEAVLTGTVETKVEQRADANKNQNISANICHTSYTQVSPGLRNEVREIGDNESDASDSATGYDEQNTNIGCYVFALENNKLINSWRYAKKAKNNKIMKKFRNKNNSTTNNKGNNNKSKNKVNKKNETIYENRGENIGKNKNMKKRRKSTKNTKIHQAKKAKSPDLSDKFYSLNFTDKLVTLRKQSYQI